MAISTVQLYILHGKGMRQFFFLDETILVCIFQFYSGPCMLLKILGGKLTEVVVEDSDLMMTNGSDHVFKANPAS